MKSIESSQSQWTSLEGRPVLRVVDNMIRVFGAQSRDGDVNQHFVGWGMSELVICDD